MEKKLQNSDVFGRGLMRVRGELAVPLTFNEAVSSLIAWILVGGRWTIGRVEEVGKNEIIMRNQVVGLSQPVRVRRGDQVIVKFAPKQS